jgi:lipopolysaccharide export system ATP-binding protein
MNSLEVTNLKKSFNGKPIVSDISLNISSGEVVGLLGPNGAGKTTTFHMMLGLIHADSGTICLDGENLNGSPMYKRARKGIGYLPQEASIFRKLKVEDNIRAILEASNLGNNAINEKLEEIMLEFSLEHIAKSYGHHLSGGERRKVEIARAIAVDPVFMLLDEPFAGIDPLAVNELKKTLRHLTARGIGLIITDHNVRETLSITDRAYIINNGHILAHGIPDDLISNELVKKNYLGEGFKL